MKLTWEMAFRLVHIRGLTLPVTGNIEDYEDESLKKLAEDLQQANRLIYDIHDELKVKGSNILVDNPCMHKTRKI